MKSENLKQRVAGGGRLPPDLLERFVVFSERVLRVTEHLHDEKRAPRIISQLVGAGTSPGAQAFEADAAMSSRDFVKCLAIATKELGECRYWLKLIGRMNWIKPELLVELEDEATQLARILHTIIIRTRENQD